jgi:hypothetical protein
VFGPWDRVNPILNAIARRPDQHVACPDRVQDAQEFLFAVRCNVIGHDRSAADVEPLHGVSQGSAPNIARGEAS